MRNIHLKIKKKKKSIRIFLHSSSGRILRSCHAVAMSNLNWLKSIHFGIPMAINGQLNELTMDFRELKCAYEFMKWINRDFYTVDSRRAWKCSFGNEPKSSKIMQNNLKSWSKKWHFINEPGKLGTTSQNQNAPQSATNLQTKFIHNFWIKSLKMNY